MNKKTLLYVIIIIFLIGPLFAVEIYVAPISYIDVKEEKVSTSIEIAKEISKECENYLLGKKVLLIEIRNEEINAPTSVLEAIKVSKEEKGDYLLYGYVEKKEYTYRAEIRFLDYEKREIRKIFYSSDDIENYERLIKDISYKIVTYLDNIFDLKIAEEKSGKRIFSIPISAGYFTYIASDWMNSVTGTVAVSSGFDLITNDRTFSHLKQKAYLSWNLNIEWRYGIGKEKVELKELNILSISFPVRVHIESIPKEEGIFFGFGFLYEFDLAKIEETYIGEKKYLYDHIGVVGSFGYQRRVSEKIRIAFDNIIDVGFQDHLMVSYSPRIRILYSVYTKEITNKWK